MSLNPQELIKQSRDSTRLSDLQNLNKSLSWFEADTGGTGFMGSSSVIYVSIPDTTSTCANLGLPTPPSGYSYRCVTAQNLQKTDGSGWIPVNFNQISFGKTLTKLPIDPINQTSTGNYYTYVAGGSWKLTTRFESQKYTLQHVAQDGGPDPALYELGTDLNLAPFVGGLVGYWSFDETGTTAYDYSGYGNNGTMYSSSTITDLHTSSDCKKGSCASFNGVNDYVEKTSPNNLTFNKAFTLMAWIKTTDNAGKIAGRWNGIQWGYMICIGEGPGIGSGYGAILIDKDVGSGSYDGYRYSETALNNNQWYHIVGVYDGDLNILDLYINGSKSNGTRSASIPNYIASQNQPFSISNGSNNTSNNRYFTGIIDEVRVYNRALSGAEIQAIYNATK